MTDNFLEEKKELLKFNKIASLATASSIDASPEVVIVNYWYDGIRSLYFATRSDSRKMQNLATNNKVSLVTVDIVNKQELQIEGTAHVVDNSDDSTAILISIHKAMKSNSSKIPVWPILKLHPKDLTIVRIIIEHSKYTNFTEENPVSESIFTDWI